MAINLNAELLEHLARIARDAMKVIMEVYVQDFTVLTKDDSSPLTEADLRADVVIRDALAQCFPGTPLLSEESSSQIATESTEFFLVDPLDGTKEFLKRNGEFTVNIALIQGGDPVAAVVGVPAVETLYLAARGLGVVRCNSMGETRLDISHQETIKPLRIVGSRSHATVEMESWLAQLKEDYEFFSVGSSLKFCRISEGKADIYPRFGLTSQWDTAAGQCVLEVAGGKVVTLDGKPLRYGLDKPILNPYFIASNCSWQDNGAVSRSGRYSYGATNIDEHKQG